jgi:hypothetical protein
MANKIGVIADLHSHLSSDSELVDLEAVRSYVSSPRLMDIYVRQFPVQDQFFVGDSFLDQRTMLADSPQRTYGVSLLSWAVLQTDVEIVEDYHYSDSSISKVQIWPFDPHSLTEPQTRLAIALSYTSLELYAEPRVIGSLNEILEEIGFFVDPERY